MNPFPAGSLSGRKTRFSPSGWPLPLPIRLLPLRPHLMCFGKTFSIHGKSGANKNVLNGLKVFQPECAFLFLPKHLMFEIPCKHAFTPLPRQTRSGFYGVKRAFQTLSALKPLYGNRHAPAGTKAAHTYPDYRGGLSSLEFSLSDHINYLAHQNGRSPGHINSV